MAQIHAHKKVERSQHFGKIATGAAGSGAAKIMRAKQAG